MRHSKVRIPHAVKEVRSDTKKKTDSRGMTLVEMIVTFAVAAIFMAAAAALVLPATKMTMQVKGMNRVHDDAAIIMETIVNELSYADGYLAEGTEEAAAPPAITLSDPYPVGDACEGCYRRVAYSDKGGNPAVMYVDQNPDSVRNGRLQIEYAQIGSETDEEGIVREKIEWEYGGGLYRDNEVLLGFERKDPGKNIITVHLTVTNRTSGYTYTQVSDVSCMNVKAGRIAVE